MVCHALEVFTRNAHSCGKGTDYTITRLVDRIKLFATQDALSKRLTKLRNNRT
ncbi:Hypothetical protein ABZS17H1_01061 [Kosakonia cowanii]